MTTHTRNVANEPTEATVIVSSVRADVDMSDDAVADRLRTVEQLRRLCVSLAEAGAAARLNKGPAPASAGDDS